MDNSIFLLIRHLDAPWIAADFAILNEAAVNVGLDIDFHPLAAERTRHNELVCHCVNRTARLRQPAVRPPMARDEDGSTARSLQSKGFSLAIRQFPDCGLSSAV
jgi:hypothetical protein